MSTSKSLLEAVWFVETKENHFVPLWRRDSHNIEMHYLAERLDIPILIYNTHNTVYLEPRVVLDSYHVDDVPKPLVRGSWYYKDLSGQYIPLKEKIAEGKSVLLPYSLLRLQFFNLNI